MICHGYFASGPLSFCNAATKSSSSFDVDFWHSLAPTRIFSLVFCVVCCELNNLKIYRRNLGQKDQLASYVENYVEDFILPVLTHSPQREKAE